MRRRHPSAILLTLALAFTSMAAPPASVALEGTELLPDLGMLPPKDFSIQQRPRGVRWLRFDSVVVNIGPGAFEAEGRGSAAADGTLSVMQQVQDGAGGWADVATPARMFYAGDGHDHWHVRDLQDWTIARVSDPGRVLNRGAKRGFCFWDNYRYGSMRSALYHPFTTSACEMRPDGTVPMGLSVGWGDEYPSTIAFQYIEITGLPNGDYIVTLEADRTTDALPRGEFVEADEGNNTAWAVIRINRKGVTVLSSGTDLEP